jgi:hypothetical protein
MKQLRDAINNRLRDVDDDIKIYFGHNPEIKDGQLVWDAIEVAGVFEDPECIHFVTLGLANAISKECRNGRGYKKIEIDRDVGVVGLTFNPKTPPARSEEKSDQAE